MSQNEMKWDALINLFSSVGCESTKQRKHNELKMPRWDRLKHLPITETSGSDFLNLLTTGGTQTKQYLGCIHKLALEMGIISHPILPRKMWPKCPRKSKRGITNAEHQRLLSNIRSWRWKLFLQILWETGAAQSDAAHFRIEKLRGEVIEYHRMKTGSRAAQQLSPELRGLIQSATCSRKKGFILPSLQRMNSKDRASIFRRACKRCSLSGISLHSYRYAWAERAFSLGMPERLAMVALGHNSSAIHRVYPKGATIVAPSLNGFQASFPKPAEAPYQRAESAY